MRRIGCSTEVSSRHELAGSPSLMARNYRIHARLHRLCGCFFIRGIFGGAEQVPTRVVWKSWYSLYSCILMGLIVWIEMDVFATNIAALANHGDRVHKLVRLFVHSVLFARMIVCFLCASFNSSKLLAFHSSASAFERRIGMTSSNKTVARNLFWSDARDVILGLAYCMAYTVTLTKLPPYGEKNNLADSPWKQAFHSLQILFRVIIYYVYDNVCLVSLRCACEVLAEYTRHQLRFLKTCLSVPEAQSLQGTETARCVESVRLNVAAIEKFKEKINHIWGVPLILSTLCVLLVGSSGVFTVCRQGASVTEQSGLVLYTLWLFYCFVRLVSASQSLTNAAEEIKDFCKEVRCIYDTLLGQQVKSLHDSIEPEDMCLKGGNFFHLNMSLLVSMNAVLVTHTVILVQTNQP